MRFFTAKKTEGKEKKRKNTTEEDDINVCKVEVGKTKTSVIDEVIYMCNLPAEEQIHPTLYSAYGLLEPVLFF